MVLMKDLKKLAQQKNKLNHGHQSEINSITKELEEKNDSISKLMEIQAENEKLKREMSLSDKKMNLEIEKAKTEISNTVTREIEKSVSERYELKLAEKDKQIELVKKSAEDAAKRASQGSMQLQGEVQEEAIEKYLLNHFPLDKILEVKKGHFGADCLQIINESNFKNCGKIYYESKNQ